MIAGHAPLAVTVDLSLLPAQGEAVTVTADGSVITLSLPRLFPRRWPPGLLSDRGRRALLLARLQRGLQVADLSLQVRVHEQIVARLTPQSRPTLLSRLLGLGSVEVRLLPGLRALLRRAPTGGPG